MRHIQQIFLFLFLVNFFCAKAQKDSVTALKEIEVKSRYAQPAAQAVTPAQTLRQADLEKINGTNIADAVQYFSGVQVKDYGGIGGLKTLSVRSLSANYTGVSYNGIMLNDAQNGQIDLGKISLDNIGEMTLYNAQPTDILQPARAFSYASVLALSTLNPAFSDSEKIKLNAAFKTGSFGLVNPSATVYYRLKPKLYAAFSGEWQNENGKYNYTYQNGSVTEKGRRTNDNLNALRAEYMMRYAINDSNVISANVYYYHSGRGLPGAIIFYTTQAGQQEWDNNFFAQASWKKKFSRGELLVNGKYNYAYTDYLDTTYPNTQHRLEMIFHQQEFYASGAYDYRFFSFMKMAYAADFFADNLHANETDFATPTRYTLLNNLSAQLQFPQLQIAGNILSTTVNNQVQQGAKPANYQAFSPTVEFIYQPAKNIPLRLRAFYKDIFRMPTFNDLYYTNVGNTNLKPEYTKQYNAGATWQSNWNIFIQSLELTADGYYNHIDNMIVAIPLQNMAQWSMQNVGKAFVRGLDLSAKIHFKPLGAWNCSLQANYTLQKALNDDPASPEYKNEIPYTPKHFASFNFFVDNHGFSFACNALFSGSRYNAVYNSSGLLMPQWNTQNVQIGYQLSGKKSAWKLVLEVNNLFNRQYQIVSYYPMPGRNFRIGIHWNK